MITIEEGVALLLLISALCFSTGVQSSLYVLITLYYTPCSTDQFYVIINVVLASATFVALPRTFLQLKGNTSQLLVLVTIQKTYLFIFFASWKLSHVMVDPVPVDILS